LVTYILSEGGRIKFVTWFAGEYAIQLLYTVAIHLFRCREKCDI